MCHNVPFFHSYVKQPEGNFSTTTMWTATKKPEARGSQKEAFFIPHGLTHGEFHPDEFSSLAHLFPSEKITGWRCQTQVTASSGLKMWGDDQEILPWGWQVDYHGGNRVPIGLVVSFCFVGETIPQKDTETETRISRSQNNDIEIDWIQNFRLFYLWLVFLVQPRLTTTLYSTKWDQDPERIFLDMLGMAGLSGCGIFGSKDHLKNTMFGIVCSRLARCLGRLQVWRGIMWSTGWNAMEKPGKSKVWRESWNFLRKLGRNWNLLRKLSFPVRYQWHDYNDVISKSDLGCGGKKLEVVFLAIYVYGIIYSDML